MFGKRLAKLAVCVVGLCAGLVVGPSTASATTQQFCIQQYLTGGSSCSGPRHSVTEIAGYVHTSYSSGTMCVTAVNMDGSQAGSWACGWNYAVHSYCGCQLRWPYIGNGGAWYTAFYGTGEQKY